MFPLLSQCLFCLPTPVLFSHSSTPAASRGLDMLAFKRPFQQLRPFSMNCGGEGWIVIFKGHVRSQRPLLLAAERMCERERGWKFNTLSPDHKPTSVSLKDGQGGTETKDFCIYILVGPKATSQQLCWERKTWWTGYKKWDFNREQESGRLTFNR